MEKAGIGQHIGSIKKKMQLCISWLMSRQLQFNCLPRYLHKKASLFEQLELYFCETGLWRVNGQVLKEDEHLLEKLQLPDFGQMYRCMITVQSKEERRGRSLLHMFQCNYFRVSKMSKTALITRLSKTSIPNQERTSAHTLPMLGCLVSLQNIPWLFVDIGFNTCIISNREA